MSLLAVLLNDEVRRVVGALRGDEIRLREQQKPSTKPWTTGSPAVEGLIAATVQGY